MYDLILLTTTPQEAHYSGRQLADTQLTQLTQQAPNRHPTDLLHVLSLHLQYFAILPAHSGFKAI
jgi:hypothetical protein